MSVSDLRTKSFFKEDQVINLTLFFRESQSHDLTVLLKNDFLRKSET